MRESLESQFQYELFKRTGKFPSDPFYEDINPYEKLWLLESWIFEREISLRDSRDLGILIGSFYNPEEAQRMVKAEKPDAVATDADETVKQIHEHNLAEDKRAKRFKRKVIR